MSDALLVSGLLGMAIALLFIRLSSLERRLNRLSRLDAKMDALLKHTGSISTSIRASEADVQEALERGETILALKRVGQAAGVGLKEPKEFVDEVRRRRATAR